MRRREGAAPVVHVDENDLANSPSLNDRLNSPSRLVSFSSSHASKEPRLSRKWRGSRDQHDAEKREKNESWRDHVIGTKFIPSTRFIFSTTLQSCNFSLLIDSKITRATAISWFRKFIISLVYHLRRFFFRVWSNSFAFRSHRRVHFCLILFFAKTVP